MSDSVLKQVDPPKEHVLFEGMARVYDKTEADEYIEALREEIARLTLLSDSQLANQERLVGEMQELRQVVKEYRECKFNIPHKKSCKFMAHHDCRCDICIKADALLAKDTPTEPKSAPEDTK